MADYGDSRTQFLRRTHERAFRVTITTPEGVGLDVTSAASQVRYTSRLPGGYTDMSMRLARRYTDLRDVLVYGAAVRVWHLGTLAWDGILIDPPRGMNDTEDVQVAAVGRVAGLRRTRFTAVPCETGYGRWVDAATLNGTNPRSEAMSFQSPTFAPGTNTVGAYYVQAAGTALAATDGRHMVYVPPPGSRVYRVKGSWAASGVSSNRGYLGASDTVGDNGAVATTIVATRTWAAGPTTFDVTLSPPRAYLSFVQQVTGASSPASDGYCGLTDMRIVCMDAAGGGPLPAPPSSTDVWRSLLARYAPPWVSRSTQGIRNQYVTPGSGLPPSGTLWPNLAFDQPTTLEGALETLNAPAGWEWGVFDNGELRWAPMGVITTAVSASVQDDNRPASYLLTGAGRGDQAAVRWSIADMITTVSVMYRENGTAGMVTMNASTRSALRADDASDIVDLGEATRDTAISAAEAILRDRARPRAQGTITLGVKMVPTNGPDAVASALIKPGHWVLIEDGIGAAGGEAPAMTTSGYIPAGLLPVRQVDVDVDSGRVVLTVDSESRTFQALQARLAARSR